MVTLDAEFYSEFCVGWCLMLEVGSRFFEILTSSTLKEFVLCFNCFCFRKELILTDGSVFGLQLSLGFPAPVAKFVHHTVVLIAETP
jgi:hypothetical protein